MQKPLLLFRFLLGGQVLLRAPVRNCSIHLWNLVSLVVAVLIVEQQAGAHEDELVELLLGRALGVALQVRDATKSQSHDSLVVKDLCVQERTSAKQAMDFGDLK